MVQKEFGKEKWESVLKKAGIEREPMITPISDVDDQTCMKVINSVYKVLNISLTQAADVFGDYWVNVYVRRIYYSYYEDCKSAKEFLLKMDSIHTSMTKAMSNAHPPRFEYEWKDDKTLIMKYKSQRNLIDIFVGLVNGVGKFYKEDLKVTKLGNDKAEIVFP